MPLVKVTLRNCIWGITEPKKFGNTYPANKLEAVVRWSNCIETYTSTIFPQSISHGAATGSFRGIFITHSFAGQDALTKLSEAIHFYAASLVPGMLAGGFVAVPPPTPPDFSALLTIGYGLTSEQVADLMANIIDTYFRTGTATPVNGGPVVNWN